MAVIISTTSGGADVGTTKVDFGQVSPGANATANLYIRNTYTNKITNARFYFAQLTSSTYDGSATAADDFTELQAWGDGGANDGVGISQDGGTNYDRLTGSTMKDDASSVQLTASATAGEIAGGGGEEVNIIEKFAVPAAEDTGGTRQWDLVFAYDFTS
jgi:hypothetical protein